MSEHERADRAGDAFDTGDRVRLSKTWQDRGIDRYSASRQPPHLWPRYGSHELCRQNIAVWKNLFVDVEEANMPRKVPAMDSRRWAIGYLRGRLRGFQRGSMTLAMVLGATLMAQRWGVSEVEVTQLLGGVGLSWNPDKQEISREQASRRATLST